MKVIDSEFVTSIEYLYISDRIYNNNFEYLRAATAITAGIRDTVT